MATTLSRNNARYNDNLRFPVETACTLGVRSRRFFHTCRPAFANSHKYRVTFRTTDRASITVSRLRSPEWSSLRFSNAECDLTAKRSSCIVLVFVALSAFWSDRRVYCVALSHIAPYRSGFHTNSVGSSRIRFRDEVVFIFETHTTICPVDLSIYIYIISTIACLQLYRIVTEFGKFCFYVSK